MNERPPAPEPSPVDQTPSTFRADDRTLAVVAAVALGGLVVWSYWPTLETLAERWSIDPQYSHGFLVPIFAAIILWLKRPESLTWSPNPWGILILAASLAPRWFAARMDLAYLDGACLIGSLLGTVLLVGGWGLFRWTAPAILFLAFMIPLPDAINNGVAVPLRRWATVVSTYVLQTLGYPAMADGNTIQIEEIRLGVIDACSGLGMLMTFLALATAMAMVLPGPLLDRAILVGSAIPIAILANVTRITVTAIGDASFGAQAHHDAIHDTLGWFMMPLALALLWLEWKYLNLLLVPVDTHAPLSVPLSPWLERGSGSAKSLWS